jgi:hypothetical protein
MSQRFGASFMGKVRHIRRPHPYGFIAICGNKLCEDVILGDEYLDLQDCKVCAAVETGSTKRRHHAPETRLS